MRKLLLLILLLSFGQAQAAFTTGSELLELCEARVKMYSMQSYATEYTKSRFNIKEILREQL
jgi:hypothetical protein